MTATEPYTLSDRYLTDDRTVFLTGIQALARLPIEQLRVDRRNGLNTAAFVSGYPGSPLGGFDGAVSNAAKAVPELPISHEPGLNEELAASAVMGSQLAAAQPDCRYDGVVGIWYGKAPGVERAADALRHAVFAGTANHGGAVALVGDDPAAKSSTVPSSSAGLLADMHMPLLYPGDPVEALDLGRHAVAMSRATGLWSALKIVADVADATATVPLDLERVVPVIPTVDGRPYVSVPDGRLLTPHTVDIEREIVEVRYRLAIQYAVDNKLNHVAAGGPDAWIGLVASGITYREVREALARMGLRTEDQIAAVGIRLLKMGMPVPFDPDNIRRFAAGLDEIFVIEEKQPTMESLIKDALYSMPDRPRVVGKTDEQDRPLLQMWGALDADTLGPDIRRRLEQRIDPARLGPDPEIKKQRTRIPLLNDTAAFEVERSPFYCSGCPHNRSTQAPEGALIGAGIGCHTMALLMDPERVGDIAGVAQMGGEGSQWIGMSRYVDRDHFIQNLGDGTFFHSGQLAIQAAVAADVNITYKLLYNQTVAMTGGQDPAGQLGVPEICSVLLTQGVAKVLITTDDTSAYRKVKLPAEVAVWDRSRLIEAQELLAEVPGVTVLIHDQGCAAEKRRDRRRGLIPTPRTRVVINHRICEGCGDCGQVSNCLSVQPMETPFGRKTTIDQTTCNLDYSCLEGDCPSFMTVTLPDPDATGGGDSGRATPSEPVLPDLPDPELVVPVDDFALRITGIGGTGVVTVAQVLGTAAMLDGYHVRGLDQIGLSQKAGPVVSDVRLSRHRPTATNRLGEGQADLLLAFDQLVAASDRGLLTTDPDRTAVVGSTTVTPTGAMITHLDLEHPTPETLAERIGLTTRTEHHHWADAAAVTNDLFGGTTTANTLVIGMAYQAGCLPISAGSLRKAIELNGVAVPANLAAFEWGRAQVADPDLVSNRRAALTGIPVGDVDDRGGYDRAGAASKLAPGLRARIDDLAMPDQLTGHLTMLAAELVAWGSNADAERWLDLVERAARAERAVGGAAELPLTTSVAANYYKLMAYKDEYEVARLMTDTDGLDEARRVAGTGGKVAWKLHPPMLRALGMDRKITVGTWATPAVKALARGKRLRGTALDPFGRAEVRRVERELVDQYRAAIDTVVDRLDADNLDRAVAIADLPDLVRGYEDIKLANIERYREAMTRLLAEL